LTRDEVVEEMEEEMEEEKEEKEEKEEEKEEEEEREDMPVGMDVDMDVDKLAKGGREGKKGKKGGKVARGKRAEEKRAEEKKSVFFFFFFSVNLFGFNRLPLEKNGPSPKSKAKKLRYLILFLFCAVSLHHTRRTAVQKDADVKALESEGVRSKPTGYVQFIYLILFLSIIITELIKFWRMEASLLLHQGA
jgi:hypothetical protein